MVSLSSRRKNQCPGSHIGGFGLNGTYHPIHIQQLRALNRITGDERFSAWADLLVSDQDPEALRAS